MKKTISILVVLGILMSFMHLPMVNAASGETAFNDTFSENLGDWEIGYAKSSEGDYTGIEMNHEGGMMKFTAPIAKDVNGAYRRPNVIRKINGGDGIAIPQDGTRLVLKSRVIIPTDGRMTFKINLPDTPASWNAARGAHTLWSVGGDGFYRRNGCTQSTSAPVNNTWRLSQHLENAVLENQAMDVTVEMYKDSNGVFRGDYSVVVAGNTYTYTGADLTQFSQTGENYSALKNIAFVAEQKTAAMNYYIDDVCVYKKSDLTATIEDEVVLGDVGTVTLNLAATPDEESILSVIDESGDAVNVTTSVNVDAKTVSATFTELPAHAGNYTLIADKVTVLNGIKLETNEFPFVVAEPEYYVNEAFGDNLGGFELGMARYYDSVSASYIDYTDSTLENSNGMLKFNAKYQGSNNAFVRVPNAIREINNGLGIDVPTDGGRLVIKTTLIMPENVTDANLSVKTNVGEDIKGWEYGKYLYDLYKITAGSGFLARNGVNSDGLSANGGIGLAYSEFAGKRMDVTTEIYFKDGVPYADHKISIEGGKYVEANNRVLTEATGVNDYTKIKNIGFFVATSSTVADYYIDDVIIYKKSTRQAQLTDEVVFQGESAGLKLNTTPDEGAALKIKNEQGEAVEVTKTTYDVETQILTATTAKALPVGTYTLVADGVTVNGGLSLEKTEYTFTVIKEEKIINEQFDEDISNWVIADDATYYDGSSYLQYEGTTLTNSKGKMVFHAPDAKDANALGRRPYIIRTINGGEGIKIPTDGQRLIIKTGITLPEDGTGLTLSMDTNVAETVKGWEAGTYYYDLFRINSTDGLKARQGFDASTRVSKNGNIGAGYDMFAGTQAEIKIEIYHENGIPYADYQITGNGKTVNANKRELSQHPNVGEDYTLLKNIAFTSEGVAADYIIDYVQVYHESGDDNLAFVDSNGENIKTLVNGDVYADITYVSNSQKDVLTAIALYEEIDGVTVLKDVKVSLKTLENHEIFADSSLKVTVSDKDNQSVKVFLWDKTTLNPILTSKILEN